MRASFATDARSMGTTSGVSPRMTPFSITWAWSGLLVKVTVKVDALVAGADVLPLLVGCTASLRVTRTTTATMSAIKTSAGRAKIRADRRFGAGAAGVWNGGEESVVA